MIHGAGGAQSKSLMRHLIVPRCLVVRMQQDVRMALDQTGQERRAGQIDNVRARGDNIRGRTGNVADLSSASRLPAIHPTIIS